MKNHFLVLLFSFAFLLKGAALADSTDEADKRLHAAIDAVLAVAQKATNSQALAADVKPILLKYVSFEAMTRRAVGPGWRQFTDDQRTKATQLFTTLIIRTYSNKFTPGEKPLFTFKAPTTPAPGRVEIPTTLAYKGSRYEVIYRLEAAENWKITDIVGEGVSLVANYRTQLDAEFKKNGAAGVIDALTRAVGSQS